MDKTNIIEVELHKLLASITDNSKHLVQKENSDFFYKDRLFENGLNGELSINKLDELFKLIKSVKQIDFKKFTKLKLYLSFLKNSFLVFIKCFEKKFGLNKILEKSERDHRNKITLDDLTKISKLFTSEDFKKYKCSVPTHIVNKIIPPKIQNEINQKKSESNIKSDTESVTQTPDYEYNTKESETPTEYYTEEENFSITPTQFFNSVPFLNSVIKVDGHVDSRLLTDIRNFIENRKPEEDEFEIEDNDKDEDIDKIFDQVDDDQILNEVDENDSN